MNFFKKAKSIKNNLLDALKVVFYETIQYEEKNKKSEGKP